MMKKKSVRKNNFILLSTAKSVKVQREDLFIFNEGAKFWNIFFISYKIKYFKSSAIDTIFSQKFNLGGNLLKAGKKVMSILGSDKN